jgi:hypothetical protein
MLTIGLTRQVHSYDSLSRVYPGSLAASTSIFSMAGSFASNSDVFTVQYEQQP